MTDLSFARGRASGIRSGLRIALAHLRVLAIDAAEQKPSDLRRGRRAAYRRAYNELNSWLASLDTDRARGPSTRRRT